MTNAMDAATPTPELLVSVSGLSKRFGGVTAIRQGDIELYRGEVHALLGENGAGKSTLVNILAGIIRPDAGVVRVRGEEVTVSNPLMSRALGISVVHQHPVLFPDMSVAENIMFAEAAPRRRTGLLDWKTVDANARKALARLDIALDTRTLVKDLSSAEQQLLEIAKALVNETALLMLDEPTAALSKREVRSLMGVIERLKIDGVGILFVGHRLDEVFELADRITVSRDGSTVISGLARDFTPESAVRYMVGRKIEKLFPKVHADHGPVRIEVQQLTGGTGYSNVSFSVRQGEILGLAGLVGAGRTEIARGIFGLDPVLNGSILVDGRPVSIRTPHDAMKHRIAYVPEDRTREGVILDQAVQFNLSLSVLEKLRKLGIVSPKKDRELCRSYIRRLAIRTTGPRQIVSSLSGGNQQKVVLGKWLASDPEILILDDPTRGVDVGAKSELYRIVSELVQRGLAIILVSNELEELLAVSDRVITFYRGRQGREFASRPFNAERVLAAMTGQADDEDDVPASSR